jgi:SAM-dependent methyltransferase
MSSGVAVVVMHMMKSADHEVKSVLETSARLQVSGIARIPAAASPLTRSGRVGHAERALLSFLRRFARSAGRAVYRAPRELVQCPACGSSSVAALATQKLPAPLDGRRTGLASGCEECGLVFVNPFPTEEQLAERYGPRGEWAMARLDETLAPAPDVAPGTGTWPRLFEPIQGELDVRRPPAGARVLDFGCGRGKFLDVLRSCGWDTFGIEPAMATAFERHQRLDVIPATPDFDLVIANHVLEHVTDPLTLLRQFAAATRPGGFLLVGVPRLDTLPIHRDRSYVISWIHVTAYTSTCLLGLLQRSGWQAVEAPSDEITISGGRRTSARLRILARRVHATLPEPSRPLDAARRALREYSRTDRSRSLAERIGGPRLAARALELKRQLRKWGRMSGVIRPKNRAPRR